MARKYILDKETVLMKLERMAYEIIENNLEEEHILLIGIRDNGTVIARNMERILKGIGSLSVSLIELTLDKKEPRAVVLSKKADLDQQVIILVDDVANSGKTMLYALKPFLESYPKKIQTLVMVERTHKAFPVNSDYVGISVSTTLQEHIYVEVDGSVVTGAWME